MSKNQDGEVLMMFLPSKWYTTKQLVTTYYVIILSYYTPKKEQWYLIIVSVFNDNLLCHTTAAFIPLGLIHVWKPLQTFRPLQLHKYETPWCVKWFRCDSTSKSVISFFSVLKYIDNLRHICRDKKTMRLWTMRFTVLGSILSLFLLLGYLLFFPHLT